MFVSEVAQARSLKGEIVQAMLTCFIVLLVKVLDLVLNEPLGVEVGGLPYVGVVFKCSSVKCR